MENYIEKAANVVPSKRQLKWHDLKFYSFIHFGMNTMTDLEWGDGTASPKLFNPESLDADQWAKAIKSAGMKGIILTAKHHDGFCLWPSKYTSYSVESSPWRDGKGDVVKEVSQACRNNGLKFGVYLSPWDRHEKTYGQGEAYNTYFKNQLRELLTNYGDIFIVWFDGACGEGENGKKQVYDWESYYEVVRECQPDACISICGPDIRWCGNEAGVCREAEWNVVPAFYSQQERIAADSQQNVDVPPENVDHSLADIGSREAIKGYNNLIWYPAEVDVSIRKGWFYHKEQDVTVKSLEKLLQIYYNSVGANASLLLNVPPRADGLIDEADVKALKDLGDELAREFKSDLSLNAKAYSEFDMDEAHCAENILSDDKTKFWRCDHGTENAEIIVDLGKVCDIEKIVLEENIATGQQIESFTLYGKQNDEWKELFEGTVIGSQKICFIKKIQTQYIKLKINKTRCFATISRLKVY